MAPCPDAEVTALALLNFRPSTLSVGSPVTEILRRNNQYLLSFSKDNLHCPKMEILYDKNGQILISPVLCLMQKMSFHLNLEA